MKLTTSTLKKIIREEIELAKVRKIIREALNEAPPDEGAESQGMEILKQVAAEKKVDLDKHMKNPKVKQDLESYMAQWGKMMKAGQEDKVKKEAEIFLDKHLG